MALFLKIFLTTVFMLLSLWVGLDFVVPLITSGPHNVSSSAMLFGGVSFWFSIVSGAVLSFSAWKLIDEVSKTTKN